MSHPLRQGPTIYNGHVRGPVTRTPNAEHLAVFLRLRYVATGDRSPISRMRGERSTSTPPRRYFRVEYLMVKDGITIQKREFITRLH